MKHREYRVLHVLNNLGSGGAETFIMNVYRKIDRNKIHFDFLIRSNKNGHYITEIISMGGQIFQMHEFPRHILKNYSELKNFFKKHSHEYDAIHVHANSLLYIKPLQLAKKYGIPCRIIHSHNVNSANIPLAKLIHLINKYRIDEYVTQKYACSVDAGKWMFLSDDYRVIKNGIDLEVFKFNSEKRNAIREYYQIGNKKVIGHVGRFSKQKNHQFLVEIFYQFQKTEPDSVLMLVGEGENKASIKELVISLGIDDKVIFVGTVTNVQDYLSAMDVFLLPSFYEGWPVAIMEAQASGLPCVVSKTVPESALKNSNNVRLSLEDGHLMWIEALNRYTRISNCSNELLEYDTTVVARELMTLYSSFLEN